MEDYRKVPNMALVKRENIEALLDWAINGDDSEFDIIPEAIVIEEEDMVIEIYKEFEP